ncbi:MAG: hypothetical protein QOE08_1273 [Thermoleophilaceae bacterium]|jgi:hypothetical protein|nr:hypothetical protein [Thermoleophilaceae bacterium]
MPKIRHTLFLAAMLCALAQPATAQASYRDAIFDCAQDGVLDGHYSNADLKKARQNLPTDLAEYTDCADVLASAVTGGPGGSHRGGAPTAPSNPALVTETGAQASSQQDLNALRDKAATNATKKAAKVKIAGHDITPGAGGVFDRAGSTEANVLPLPLLLSLIALGAMCALAGAVALRRQWPATRRVALRIFRR